MPVNEDENMLMGIRESLERLFEAEMLRTVDDAQQDRPLHVQMSEIRKKLKKYGTDVDRNDADPTGDGDQSAVTLSDSGKQVYRDLYGTGKLCSNAKTAQRFKICSTPNTRRVWLTEVELFHDLFRWRYCSSF